ncbi:MAG: hypothetical protein SV062_12085 [Thermodesulfobacteriota bacterium]|nr:hypothetical protein [Thermodesulfobacteriota bacterium]
MKKNIPILQGNTFIVIFITLSISLLYAEEERGSTFSEIWGQVTSDPYEKPQYKVTLRSFFSCGVNMLLEASERTINNDNDILPQFDKLLHPNGACLSGTWNITEENPYSGYFEKGRVGLIIARASVALSKTTRGHYRAFGMAGKIYPTNDPFHTEKLQTANFFVIDNLSGTLADNYTDVALTNEPEITYHPGISFLFPVAVVAAYSLGSADKNPGIRQLYPISELGFSDKSLGKTPTWMKIQAPLDQMKVGEKDFRDELNVMNYDNGQLFFDIYVTTEDSTKNEKEWLKVGYILFDDFIVSNSCDHRLHFPHPIFR